MAKIPWRKIVVIGSTFLLGMSAGLGVVMVTDPTFNPTFAPKDTIQTNYTNETQAEPESTPVQGSEQANSLSQVEQTKIVDDYKLALALLFEAWRSPDMQAFEKKLVNAYTGEIKNRHLDRAQVYIANGKGLYIDDLKFDTVQVESANATTATLTATYTYAAKDFDLEKTQAYGEKVNHEVHVRVDLSKIGDRWLISGETAI